MQKFGASRASVREAIRLLAQKGMVIIRPGSGTFVTKDVVETIVQSFSPLLSQPAENAGDVFEFRLLLEPQVASLAAIRATDEDIRKMRQILDSQQIDIESGGTGVAFDTGFHAAIAAATNNPALVTVTDAISGILSQSRSDELISTDRSRKSLHSHVQILNGMESRDPNVTYSAMYEHISQIDREVHNLPISTQVSLSNQSYD